MPELACLAGRRLHKALVLCAFFCYAGQLHARLLQLRGSRGNARLKLGDALGVAAFARNGALQFQGRLAGPPLGFLAFLLQRVAALGQQCWLASSLSIFAAELLMRSVSAAISSSNFFWSASIAAMRLANTTRSRSRSSSRTAA